MLLPVFTKFVHSDIAIRIPISYSYVKPEVNYNISPTPVEQIVYPCVIKQKYMYIGLLVFTCILTTLKVLSCFLFPTCFYLAIYKIHEPKIICSDLLFKPDKMLRASLIQCNETNCQYFSSAVHCIAVYSNFLEHQSKLWLP